jgi:hypothetical protein
LKTSLFFLRAATWTGIIAHAWVFLLLPRSLSQFGPWDRFPPEFHLSAVYPPLRFHSIPPVFVGLLGRWCGGVRWKGKHSLRCAFSAVVIAKSEGDEVIFNDLLIFWVQFGAIIG